jgi:hypothetical protein
MTHRVAVVGNGPSLLTHSYGAQIDACDEVVRINAYQLGGAYAAHVGNKVTVWTTYMDPDGYAVPREVWWCEFGYIHMPEERKRAEAWCLRNKARFVWLPDDVIERAFKELAITPDERQRKNGCGMKPSTGIIAIECARVEWPASEIYVAGFDGFVTGDSYHYYDTESKLTPSVCRKHFPGRQQEYITRLVRDGKLRTFA